MSPARAHSPRVAPSNGAAICSRPLRRVSPQNLLLGATNGKRRHPGSGDEACPSAFGQPTRHERLRNELASGTDKPVTLASEDALDGSAKAGKPNSTAAPINAYVHADADSSAS